jgi:chaperonin cofactor prefoldin
MNTGSLTDNLKTENSELKKKIKLYEISSKIDYEKIEKLKEEIRTLRQLGQFKTDYGCR